MDQLLEQLTPQIAAVKMASNVLDVFFSDLVEAFEEGERARRDAEREARRRIEVERIEAQRRQSMAWFETLTLRSNVRLAQKTAWASVKTVGTWESGYFQSLVADREYNLNAWVSAASGPQKARSLTRLQMYPILLQESGRMGFARVGKERISYVRDNVAWHEVLTLNGQRYKIVTRFPDTSLSRRNITLEFNPQGGLATRSCTINVLFNGDMFRIVEDAVPRVTSDFEKGVR